MFLYELVYGESERKGNIPATEFANFRVRPINLFLTESKAEAI